MHLKKLSNTLIFTGGIIEIMIGIFHFIWASDLKNIPCYTNLSEPIKDLLLLATLSVGLCLTFFGFLSIYFSKKVQFNHQIVRYFSFSQSILWTIRLILELTLPVKVPIFSFENPSNLIAGGAILVIVIYFIPVILLKRLKAINE